MLAAISKTNIKVFQKAYKSSPTNKLSRNALTRTSMLDVAMDWDAFRKVDHTYSHTIPNEIKKVTNQKASGRCWARVWRSDPEHVLLCFLSRVRALK